ncbi:MAG: 50S ribosomal protein L24 [Firmicutes bacterium]|nr:50S ribosomal protein L24 [Bacillota bacterium]MCL5038553.1 50S ribosomal protein L24 [Bacillota bacterium]
MPVTAKIHVKKGDTVLIISGKDKGKKGKVLSVIPDKGRVVVEGVNVIKKHQKPTQKVMQGGIINQEAPIHSSKVMVFCTKCGSATRIGHRTLADGRSVRVCQECGEALDK